jgi:hypothetical protein
MGMALWPAVRARRDQDLAVARATLGEAAFKRAWSRGLATPLEHAIDDALLFAHSAQDEDVNTVSFPAGA